MEQRDIAKNEHTMNIRAGLPIMKSLYGQTMDEYDYLDLAVDSLRDIRHFGITEYYSIVTVRSDGTIPLPCNLDIIDAVTTEHMGLKAFDTRVNYDLEGLLGTDAYFSAVKVMSNLNHHFQPGLGGRAPGEGYISYQLSNKGIKVAKEYIGRRISIAFTGITVDLEGFPFITRKQANALAAISSRAVIMKATLKGDKGAASMLEYITGTAARLKQAASIPEDFSDNELDEVLDEMTTFNRKSNRRPTRTSR